MDVGLWVQGGLRQRDEIWQIQAFQRWRKALLEDREEAEELILEWEKTISHLLSKYGEMLFPHVWREMVEMQIKLGNRGTIGEGIEIGVAGNVTVTHNFKNKGHTDKDKTPAWAVWATPDVTGRRSHTQVNEAILHHSYFVLPTLGLAVKLYDGAALAWHSAEVIHGTTAAVWKNVPNADNFIVIGSSTQWAKRLVARIASEKTQKKIDLEGPPERKAEIEKFYGRIDAVVIDSDDETLQEKFDKLREKSRALQEARKGKGKGKGKGNGRAGKARK